MTNTIEQKAEVTTYLLQQNEVILPFDLIPICYFSLEDLLVVF